MTGHSQTNLKEIDETHCAFQLENASNINHICVFLLGTGVRSLLDNIGYTNTGDTSAISTRLCRHCSFFLAKQGLPIARNVSAHSPFPNPTLDTSPRLSNEKPSAIFRVRGTFGASDYAGSQRFTQSFQQQSQPMIPGPTASDNVTALLGIAIEPIDAVISQVSTLSTSGKSVADPDVLAERIARHLLNFTSSFGMASIPQRAIEQWYESFRGKVRAMGTSFLERAD